MITESIGMMLISGAAATVLATFGPPEAAGASQISTEPQPGADADAPVVNQAIAAPLLNLPLVLEPPAGGPALTTSSAAGTDDVNLDGAARLARPHPSVRWARPHRSRERGRTVHAVTAESCCRHRRRRRCGRRGGGGGTMAPTVTLPSAVPDLGPPASPPTGVLAAAFSAPAGAGTT